MVINVRFFKYDDEQDLELVECNESDFLAAEGTIEYERHSVFEDGVNQICLTKNPFIQGVFMYLYTVLAITATCFLWRWFIQCRIFGHKWDSSFVLVRDCKCCHKRQALKIGVGYVD